MAEQWGIPPWEIEAGAPAVWVERWEALQDARVRHQRDPKRAEMRGRSII